jgi:hypothetical protein
MSFNSFGSIGAAGEESTYGAPVARAAAWEVTRIKPDVQQGFRVSDSLYQAGSAHMPARQHRDGSRNASLDIGGPLLYEGCGLLLKSWLGSVTTLPDTPSAGRHTHEYTPGATLPSLTWEAWLGTNLNGGDLSTVLDGGVCSTWSITLEQYSRAKFEASYICEDMAAPAAAGTVPTVASGEYIEHDDCTAAGFTWGSVYGFQRAVISGNNAVARRGGYGTQTTLQPYKGGSGLSEITITIEREYEGDTFRAAYLAQTQNDLTIDHANSGGDTFNASLQNARISEYTGPDPNSPGGYLTERIVFRGFADPGSSEPGFSIVMENSQASGVSA